jgi:flavin-binding protein dodecin
MKGWAASSDKETAMSVAKVSEISSTSTKSFEDAINTGIARASKTIRNIRSAWIKEQQVRLEKGSIVEYQVNMMLTFVVDD